MSKPRAIIIGAGPAGLTAALELLRHSDIEPVVLEMSEMMGGISRTEVHDGNRIDIGGHRFFSKSSRVMNWWLGILPIQGMDEQGGQRATLYGQEISPDGPDPEQVDPVMLVRGRKSRIYYQGRFFNYPVSLDPDTLRKLGLRRTARIGASYIKASLRQKPEDSLETFMINRFGRELYLTFFKEYTEKVWGTPCDQISAEWGAQRIKGLSLRSAIAHFFKQALPTPASDVGQQGTETSLIEKFLYPKLGPGQMWETVADKIREGGGKIHTHRKVVEILGDRSTPGSVCGVRAVDPDGKVHEYLGDYVISTMPIVELLPALAPSIPAPAQVQAVADGLLYRDFITVGVLLDDLAVRERVDGRQVSIQDNWIYIQEPGVKVGRIQVFNNWSPYMVRDPDTIFIGMEYFCNVGDDLWSREDEDLARLGVEELASMGLARRQAVRDTVVIRAPKTYPAYFGSYDRFDTLREWVDGIPNLFLIGRNGMHRYNNQDHSMLTAMTAVENIVAGRTDKANIWAVNTEQDYHEAKAAVR